MRVREEHLTRRKTRSFRVPMIRLNKTPKSDKSLDVTEDVEVDLMSAGYEPRQAEVIMQT